MKKQVLQDLRTGEANFLERDMLTNVIHSRYDHIFRFRPVRFIGNKTNLDIKSLTTRPSESIKIDGCRDENTCSTDFPALRASCSFSQILIYLSKIAQITQNLFKGRFSLLQSASPEKTVSQVISKNTYRSMRL